MVLSCSFDVHINPEESSTHHGQHLLHEGILRASKQIRQEALSLYLGSNNFFYHIRPYS